MNHQPQYLYRYTNVDNLKYILLDKTIRFSPLTSMDDKLEQFSASDNEEGKCVFISCWTEEQAEDMKMWNNYCRPDSSYGIRIKLPANPFSENNKYLPTIQDVQLLLSTWALSFQDKMFEAIYHKIPSTIDEHWLMLEKLRKEHPEKYLEMQSKIGNAAHDETYCLTPDINYILHKVQYTDEVDELFPMIYKRFKGIVAIDFENYGKVKDLSWKWQKEWRYILHFRRLMNGIYHKDGTINIYQLPFDHYDLLLSDTALSEIEITLSPDISEKNRSLVLDIISKSTVKDTVKLYESSLLANSQPIIRANSGRTT